MVDKVSASDLYAALRLYNTVVTDTTHINTIIADEFERLNKVRPIPENDTRYLVSRRKSEFKSKIIRSEDTVYQDTDLDLSKLVRVIDVTDQIVSKPLNFEEQKVDSVDELVNDEVEVDLIKDTVDEIEEFEEDVVEDIDNVYDEDDDIEEAYDEIDDVSEDDDEGYTYDSSVSDELTDGLSDEFNNEIDEDFVSETENSDVVITHGSETETETALETKKQGFTERLTTQVENNPPKTQNATTVVLEPKNHAPSVSDFMGGSMEELHHALIQRIKSVQSDPTLTARTKKEVYRKEIENHMVMMLRMNLSLTQVDLFKVYDALGIVKQAREVFTELNKRNKILVHNGKLRLFR